MRDIARRRRLAEIEGRQLITFDVAADGRRFRLNFTDAQGRPSALTLPTECLNDLLMTLPRIASRALHARYQDSSLRIVFPAEEWRLEGSDDRRLILTIGTSDGFEASFLLERDHLRDIADSLQDEAAAGAPARPIAN
jgi:hypothetical protein